MMEPTDWDVEAARMPILPAGSHADPPWQIEVEERLARIETKQDALYTEIHAVRLEFAKLVEGVMGAMTSNPLLSRLLGGGKKER
jgi:hypothetical protein